MFLLTAEQVPKPLADEGIQAGLTIPLQWHGELFGFLNLWSTQAERYKIFNREGMEVVKGITDQLSVALQQARLLEETTEALTREHRLKDVVWAISSELDLQSMIPEIVRLADELVGADTGSLSILDPDGETMSLAYFHNPPKGYEFGNEPLHRVNGGVAWEILDTGQSIVIDEYPSHPLALDIWKQAGVHAFMGVPVIAGEDVLGVLGLFSFQAGKLFGQRERLLIETIGRQAGIAIRNARLLEATQRLNAELENRVKERTKQLEFANRELEAFSYSVSHDLRAPLRAVNAFSQILLESHQSLLDSESQSYLQRIVENTDRMNQLISDMLTFSRLSRQPLNRQTVKPQEVVEHVLSEALALEVSRTVDVQIADLPPCQADPSLLRQVYANLIGNALKYTRGRAHTQIEVGWQTQDDQVIYFIRDNGVGFDMRYADKAFGVFQRLHRAEDFEGSGVGLAIVQQIIQRHGGRVWLEAEVDQGTTVFFTLGEHPLYK